MPQTQIHLFRQSNGEVPFLDWFNELEVRDPKAFAQCNQRILELTRKGNDLERPLCGFLRNGIYELRFKNNTVQYRVLYFFNGKSVAFLSHGIRKHGKKVPDAEIDAAIRHMKLVESNPQKYTADF